MIVNTSITCYNTHMKTVGIIAEFNPFHNGHKYLIENAKKNTGSDYVVVVMSGSFVQRGEPAFMYKYDRIKAALNCGADLVLELPFHYSTATAETFAFGGVSLLNGLNTIDFLAFGSECGQIEMLTKASNALLCPTDEYQSLLQSYLEEGLSYPAARSKALFEFKDILDCPNNILGIEYLKAITKLSSKIIPFTILRNDSGYNNDNLSCTSFSSAKAIRKALFECENIDSFDEIRKFIPEEAMSNMLDTYHISYPISLDDMSEQFFITLLRSTPEEISALMDMNRDIANRIFKNINDFTSISEFITKLKTKELTYSRLSRAILHILLNTKDITRDSKNELIPCKYSRILGFKQSSRPLLHEIVGNSSIPLINKAADANKILNGTTLEMFNATINADRIYDYLIYKKYGTHQKDGCLISPIII